MATHSENQTDEKNLEGFFPNKEGFMHTTGLAHGLLLIQSPFQHLLQTP